MSKIKPKVIGFLLRAEYSTYYHDIFQDFENEFVGADSVSITIKGTLGGIMDYREPPDPIKISEDGKTVNIKFEEFSYLRGRSKQPELPDENQVLQGLRSILERAAKEYIAKFPSESQNDQTD
jgi:hypothetical protein